VHVKPFVRWIWLGGLLTGLGGALAAFDRRYRLKAERQARESITVSEAAA
jgi:cytochrome c-type biogenesis protein CcmF